MRLLIGAVAAAAALVCAAVAVSAMITRHATTATYSLTLSVGPSEKMYTAAEVEAKHPTTGEVMVGDGMSMGGSGSMSMRGSGASMGGMVRHLEVHVGSRATGKTVTNVAPTILLTDTKAKAMTDELDVMAMAGIGEGIADLHYGNNVSLMMNHVYKVVVKIKREQATFTFKAV
jgi:hypothetical protein